MTLVFVFSAFFTGLLPVACSTSVEKGDQKIAKWGPRKNPASGNATSEQPAGLTQVKPFSDPEAFDYLWNTCGSCHGPDGAYKSNWAMPAKDKISVASLEGVEGITKAYQSLVNKFDGNEGASPSAMPFGVDFSANPKAKQDSARAIKWFAERMVGVVKDAESLYPKDEKSGSAAIKAESDVVVSLNYKCASLRTGTSYLTKLTSALYNRNPNEAEMALLGDKRDMPLSHEERLAISGRIKSDPASVTEFEQKALKSFATKVADAAKILPAQIDGVVANRNAVQADLKEEFYQLLLKYYKDVPYRDILLMDKVMVTARTAPLYTGCTAPVAPATWAECTLSPDRSNYFGTVGFLRAKPGSFLENGNNYGRAGAMFVVASGEALLPQTNGPVGSTVNGLPECLTSSSKDARGRVNTKAVAGVDEPLTGPFGSLTVPGFGNVCQGCHVRRGLAAGSKIYRTFGKFGEKISGATLDAACGTPTAANPCPGVANNPYRDDVVEAIRNDKANYDNGQQRFATDAPAQKARDATLDKTSRVTVQLLKELLTEASDRPGTCIPVDSKTVKQVSTIKDMSEFVVGSQANVARGLARMIPKAIARTQLTNQEVIMEVNKASVASNGKLADMIVAYVATETFACQEE
ncbi:MAG: hypothetical protein RI953_658 [Pseudomonadota bacterium]|jgi:hypothetical protein